MPDGGFSFDVTLKSFGTGTNQTRIQFQPPGRVRYFTPRDDGTFSASKCSLLFTAYRCTNQSHPRFREWSPHVLHRHTVTTVAVSV